MLQLPVESFERALFRMHCQREPGSTRHREARIFFLRTVTVATQRNRSAYVVEASRVVVMSKVGVGGALRPAGKGCRI